MEQWISVSEYAVITGRAKQSIYKSIERGTLESKVVAGIKLVKVVQADETDDRINQSEQSEPTETPNTSELTASQTADFISVLKATIAELHADKNELKQEKAELKERISKLETEIEQLRNAANIQPIEQPPIEHECFNQNSTEMQPNATDADNQQQPAEQPPTKASFGARLRYLVRGY